MAEKDEKDPQVDPKDADPAEGEPKEDDPKKVEDDDDDDPEGADQLGEAGKKALERMKADRRAARTERNELKKQLDETNAKLKTHADKDLSESQRLQKERDELRAELGKERSVRQRREAAEEYAPDDADTKLIRAAAKWINGETDAELEASAKEFYSLFSERAPAKQNGNGLPGKPKERLRGGGRSSDGDDDETDDPRKLAEKIGRSR
jgi:hypothetical protein